MRVRPHSHTACLTAPVRFAGQGQTPQGSMESFFKSDQMPPKPPGAVSQAFKAIQGWLFPSTVLTLREQRLDKLLDKMLEQLSAKAFQFDPERIYFSSHDYYFAKIPEITVADAKYSFNGEMETYYRNYSKYREKRYTLYRSFQSGQTMSLSYCQGNKTVYYSDTGNNIHISSPNRYLRKKAQRFFKQLLRHAHQVQQEHKQYLKRQAELKAYLEKAQELEKEKNMPDLQMF